MAALETQDFDVPLGGALDLAPRQCDMVNAFEFEHRHQFCINGIVVRDNSVNAKLMSMFELEGIDHVALSGREVERSAQWYIEVLGFERRHEGMWNGIPTFIGKGTTAIALFPARIPNSKTAAREDKIDPPIGRIRPLANIL